MKGFSFFAPVLGAMLVVAALSTAAFISKEEAKKRADIDAMAAKIYLNALPEALKWDAVSSYITALRDWFYDAYVYTPGALRNPPKRDIADTMISYIGNDENAPWLILSNMAYRYYVKGDPQDLADIMDVTTDRKKIYVKIFADMGKIPILHVDLNIGRSGGQSENLDIPLFTSEVGFPIYYPAEEIENNIDRIKTEARNHYFIAGILPWSKDHGNDAVAVIWDGTTVKVIENIKTWKGRTDLDILRPAEDAYYAFPENESEAESEYVKRGAVDDAIREWLESIGMSNVQVWSIPEYEGEEGIPYFRLICVEGELAYLLTGDSGEVCVKVPEGESVYEIEGDKIPYVKIKKVVVEGTITASSTCAPSSKQTVSARVKTELEFRGSESIKQGKIVKHTIAYSGKFVTGSKTESCEECTSRCGCTSCDTTTGEKCYDCGNVIDDAEEACKLACANESKGFLSGSDCEKICETEFSGNIWQCSTDAPEVTVRWWVERQKAIDSILSNLRKVNPNNYSEEEDKEKATLIKLFADNWGSTYYESSVDGHSGYIFLSKTTLDIKANNGNVDVENTTATATVCVTNTGC